MPYTLLFYPAGAFTLALGIAHFFFPILLDFRGAIPKAGPPLKPFRLSVIHYATQRGDVHGIAWVMNHSASYVLVSVGALDLLWPLWIHAPSGRWLCLGIAGWWLIRAASQLYLGTRRGDWLILAGFAGLAVLHLAGAVVR